MPSNVARFEQLFYASLILGVFIFASNFDRRTTLEPASSVIGTAVFTVAVLVLLTWLIARRRQNWARWVLVVLYVAGLPFAVFAVINMSEQRILNISLSALQAVLQVVALLLLFTGNARA